MNKNYNINNTKNVGYEIKNTNVKSFNMKFGFRTALTYIFIALVILMVVRISMNKDVVTLSSLLDFLGNFNVSNGIVDFFRNISTGISHIVLPDLSFNVLGVDINIFNNLRSLLQIFLDIEQVVFWLVGNLVYVITFLIKLLEFVFVL